jgi:hypothetical protein
MNNKINSQQTLTTLIPTILKKNTLIKLRLRRNFFLAQECYQQTKQETQMGNQSIEPLPSILI